MNWLRSEDLKEEKNVTTPIFIVAGQPAITLGSFTESVSRRGKSPNLICIDQSAFHFWPRLLIDPRKEALMGSRRLPEISWALCRKPVDLLIDLTADENGKAVHEECYVKRLTSSSSNRAAAIIAA